jgi:hypothetical protein
MRILRSLFNRLFGTKSNEPLDINNSQGILIRPDGSWIVAPPQKQHIQHHPYAPQNPCAGMAPIPGKDMQAALKQRAR